MAICTFIHACFMLMVMFLCIKHCDSNSQLTKVFVHFETIDVIVPLPTGFHIILTEKFADKYLTPDLRTHLTMFFSATEVTEEQNPTDVKQIEYGDKLSRANTLKMMNLKPNTWYYLCVEFILSSRQEKVTSTDCRLARTLDIQGQSSAGPVSKLAPLCTGADFLEFKMEVDTQAPSRVTAFLEKGSRPAQVFMIDKPAELETYFGDLNSGTNYGRFCVLFEPMVEAYSMLGRSIQITNLKCYERPVTTEKN